MARRVIGLDVGTHAVRVAEVELEDPPRVTAFGQVALPYDAVRDGEIVDAGAVTKAVERLWNELGLGKGEVRLGIASPRVIVRTVDMPAMSEADLEGALRFQAGDLIPIPLDEAALLIAAHAHPDLDVDTCLARIDAIAAGSPGGTAPGSAAVAPRLKFDTRPTASGGIASRRYSGWA